MRHMETSIVPEKSMQEAVKSRQSPKFRLPFEENKAEHHLPLGRTQTGASSPVDRRTVIFAALGFVASPGLADGGPANPEKHEPIVVL
jgi:hypothetical protein